MGITMKTIFSCIFISIFIAAVLTFSPGSAFIFFLAFLVGLLLWLRLPEQNEKEFLVKIISAGFLLRVFALLFIYFLMGLYGDYKQTLDERVIATFGDGAYSTIRSWRMAKYWLGETMSQKIIDSAFYPSFGRSGYLYVLAFFHYIFGFGLISSRLINCLLGTATAVFVYFIAKEIFTIKVAKLSAVFTMFFPSLFLWSLSNLKEPTIIFMGSVTLWSFIKLQKKRKLYYLLFLVLALYSLGTLRHGLWLCMIGIVFFSFICASKLSILKKISICLITIASLQAFLFVNNKSLKSAVSGKLASLVIRHKGVVLTGGSVYKLFDGNYHLVNPANMNLTDYAKVFFRAWVHFLFEPFPWKIHSKQMLLSYPQIVLCYVLVPFAFWGMILAARYNWRLSSMLFIYSFVIISVSAISGGNIGTAFRHRDMVTPVFLIFAAAGLLKAFGKNFMPEQESRYEIQ